MQADMRATSVAGALIMNLWPVPVMLIMNRAVRDRARLISDPGRSRCSDHEPVRGPRTMIMNRRHRSTTTSSNGCAQQTSTLPSAGGSISGGS